MTDLKNIQQQKRFRVLLIGDDCVDVYRYGTIDRISPEAPVPVFKFSHEEHRPGMAGNVKENLETMGCDVTFLSNGISTKTRLIDIRSRQHIVRIDEDVKSEPLDIEFDSSDPPNFDAIVISDYNKGTVSYELIKNIIKHYKGPIFVDTKKTDLCQFEGCFVKINELEYSLVKSKCSELIVTLGSKGAKYKNKIFEAPKVEVSDVTGAGDTFLSALTVGFLLSKSIEVSIPLAIKAASMTVQKLGVHAPRWEELCD
jgi:D-beta-D-heptose 7-phosphate kinase/D-beta-D-heptose 1-phosphate adenosyltransferase